DLAGDVSAVLPGGHTVCGQIVLASFSSKPAMDRGFLVTLGRAKIGNPGEGLFGVIRSSSEVAAAIPQPDSSGKITIVVHKTSEVDGDTVTLGDLGDIQADARDRQTLSGLVFCSTPPVGVDMAVTANRVQTIAKRAGIDVQVQIDGGSVVRRKFQAVKQEDIVDAAIEAAQGKIGAAVPLELVGQGQGDFKAPPGKVSLNVRDVSENGAQITVTIDVLVDGKLVNGRSVELEVGASARVRAGQVVKVIMKTAGVTVQVSGKTQTGGMVGQTITVVTDTGGVLSGVVLDSETVEVKI
ncbi:MAG TPA: flagella basal body P-ring formation protein FlgA, partial [Fimbriimonadaceae bacterium]|nr:flagella basal body P-ring formation protein FlgA [Fimbriimonadaceae bacterium]